MVCVYSAPTSQMATNHIIFLLANQSMKTIVHGYVLVATGGMAPSAVLAARHNAQLGCTEEIAAHSMMVHVSSAQTSSQRTRVIRPAVFRTIKTAAVGNVMLDSGGMGPSAPVAPPHLVLINNIALLAEMILTRLADPARNKKIRL